MSSWDFAWWSRRPRSGAAVLPVLVEVLVDLVVRDALEGLHRAVRSHLEAEVPVVALAQVLEAFRRRIKSLPSKRKRSIGTSQTSILTVLVKQK